MRDAASRAAGPLPPLAAALRGASWVGALVAASLLVLRRPRLWVIALAGFLVRGGVLVVLLPIVVLPTPIQLAASFGLDAVSISGEPTARFIQEVGLTLIALLVWLLASGIAGAVVEIVVGREIGGVDDDMAGERETLPDGVGPPAGPRVSSGLAWSLLLVRLVTLVPVVLALAWGVRRVIDVGYREVTVPSDTATPLVLRIAEGAIDAVAVIVAVWLIAELVLALATRHLLFDRLAARRGRRSVRALLRRPVPILGAFLVGMAVSAVVLAAGVVAVQVAWDRVQFELRADALPEALVAIVLLVLVWVATLTLAGFLSAWRSGLMTAAYLWTMEAQDGGVLDIPGTRRTISA